MLFAITVYFLVCILDTKQVYAMVEITWCKKLGVLIKLSSLFEMEIATEFVFELDI